MVDEKAADMICTVWLVVGTESRTGHLDLWKGDTEVELLALGLHWRAIMRPGNPRAGVAGALVASS